MRRQKTDTLISIAEESRIKQIPISKLIEKAIKDGLLDDNLNPINLASLNADNSKLKLPFHPVSCNVGLG